MCFIYNTLKMALISIFFTLSLFSSYNIALFIYINFIYFKDSVDSPIFFPFTICFPSLCFGTWSQMNRISMENTFIISLSKLQCILIFNVKNIDITFSVLQCILSNIAKHNIFWYNVVRYKKIFKHFTEKRCYRRFLIEFILYNSDNTFCS